MIPTENKSNVLPMVRRQDESIVRQVGVLKSSLTNMLVQHERLIKLQLGEIGKDLKIATAAGTLALPFSTAALVLLGLCGAFAWSGSQPAGVDAVALMRALGVIGGLLLVTSVILMVVSSARTRRIQKTIGDIAGDLGSDFRLPDHGGTPV